MVRRGGARPGAGRPKSSGKFGESTQVVRVPISLVPEVLKMIEDFVRERINKLFNQKEKVR